MKCHFRDVELKEQSILILGSFEFRYKVIPYEHKPDDDRVKK